MVKNKLTTHQRWRVIRFLTVDVSISIHRRSEIAIRNPYIDILGRASTIAKYDRTETQPTPLNLEARANHNIQWAMSTYLVLDSYLLNGFPRRPTNSFNPTARSNALDEINDNPWVSVVLEIIKWGK